MTIENENINSNNDGSALTEEQKRAQAEQEEADRKVAESNDAEVLREQNKKLFERAKAAENEKKAMKAERDAALANANNSGKVIKKDSDLSPEELRLIARGMSDEIIDKAKVIAKGQGISLTEALKDPMLQSFQDKLKEDEKREKAKLGASKGSRQAEEEISFRAGMTDAEHKAAFEKLNQG